MWQVPTENMHVGDMVVIEDDNRIDSVFPGTDGNVGVLDIRTARSEVSEVPKAERRGAAAGSPYQQVLRKLHRTRAHH